MTQFARRYASYHKCRKATEYLADAISLTSGALEKRHAEVKIAQDQQERTYRSKYGALQDAINACFKEYDIEKIAGSIVDAFCMESNRAADNFECQTKQIVLKCCRDARKEKYKTGLDGRIQEATRRLSEEYSEQCREILKKLYNEKDTALRSTLVQTIRDDTATSEAEKQLLQDIVMKTPPMPAPERFSIQGQMKAHKFLNWRWVSVDEKTCGKEANNWANESRLKIAGYAQLGYRRQYEAYCAALSERLSNPRNLEKWNPTLAALAQQIDKTELAIHQLHIKREELRQKKYEVESLMKKQEV